ncbi:MAG: AMP-binding protein, partial [Gemmatimonadota bacterium]
MTLPTPDHLPHLSVSDALAGYGKRTPNRTAIVLGDERITWRELDTRVNQVANGLLALGVRKGDKVALITSNSVSMVEIMVGIIRIGAVMVPLSLLAPAEGWARMLEDSGAVALFVSEGHDRQIEPHLAGSSSIPGTRRFGVGFAGAGWVAYEPWRTGQTTDRVLVPMSLTDEHNIIYSSGTTGVPKGIVHTHYARHEMALGLGLDFRFHPRAVALITTSLYSNGTWMMFIPSLAVGATMVIMTKWDVPTALQLISRERVTHTFMVPPQFAAVMAAPEASGADFSSLEVIVSAGSALRSDLKAILTQRMCAGLIELYGLTEGVGTTLKPYHLPEKIDSVGLPVLGSDFRVIDDQGRELGPGEIGELVGYASGLMKGYHNLPEATGEMIWRGPAGRSYLKTGDIGKIDEDGFLYILDRKKDMIISGGFNVFPADIEQVIGGHPDVSDVTVIGIPH